MEVYIVFYKDNPYQNNEGVRIFDDYKKAKNYRDNAVRNIGRLICEDKDWYDMGEKSKQKWFDRADKLLKVKTFVQLESDKGKTKCCYCKFYEEDNEDSWCNHKKNKRHNLYCSCNSKLCPIKSFKEA